MRVLGAVFLLGSFAWGQAAPAPCVESMPGMVMCPKASPEATKLPDSGASAAEPAMKMDMTSDGGMSADKGMKELMENMHPQNFVQEILHHAASGTSAEPAETPVPMLMAMKGPWMLMLHGNAFATDQQQTGPRGWR